MPYPLIDSLYKSGTIIWSLKGHQMSKSYSLSTACKGVGKGHFESWLDSFNPWGAELQCFTLSH